jgi:hypothetical protein
LVVILIPHRLDEMGRGFLLCPFFFIQRQTFYIQHHFFSVQCTVIISVPASHIDTLGDKKQEIVRLQETVSLLQIALFFCNKLCSFTLWILQSVLPCERVYLFNRLNRKELLYCGLFFTERLLFGHISCNS